MLARKIQSQMEEIRSTIASIKNENPPEPFKLSKPQRRFFNSKHKFTAIVCGFRAGKTFVGIARLAATAAKYKTIDMLYVAPSYGVIKEVGIPGFRAFFDHYGIGYEVNKQDKEIKLHTGAIIRCKSMEAADKIIGFDVGDVLLDEFDTPRTDISHEVMHRATSRLSSRFPDGKKNQIFVATTPEGFKATYELFKAKPLVDSLLIKASTHSNARNIPDDYIKTLEDQYPKQLLQAYLNGEFVNLTQGQVYFCFDRKINRVDRTNEIVAFKAKAKKVLKIGMDFNIYHMAATIGFKTDDGKIIVMDEIIDARSTQDVIEVIHSRYPENEYQIDIFPDASGGSNHSEAPDASNLDMLRSQRWRVLHPAKNPLVSNRVASVNNCFEKQRLEIHTGCNGLIEAFERQVYDRNGIPDKNDPVNHILDSAGYLSHYHFPINRPTGKVQRRAGLY